MSWLDISILVVLGISFFIGLKQGIIKAAITLAGMVIGVTLASRSYLILARRLTFIPRENIANIVAFAAILLAVLIVAAIVARVLTKVASAIMLGWFNRLGGAVFGLTMGALFCGAAIAVWSNYVGPNSAISNSVLAAVLLDKFPVVLALLPPEFDFIRSFFR
ncbi:MAG: CvpA family protein [Chloroflexota bacterium]